MVLYPPLYHPRPSREPWWLYSTLGFLTVYIFGRAAGRGGGGAVPVGASACNRRPLQVLLMGWVPLDRGIELNEYRSVVTRFEQYSHRWGFRNWDFLPKYL